MKIGFIGAGNMGSAIIRGLLRSGMLPADAVLVSRRRPEQSRDLAEEGVLVVSDNRRVAAEADCVVLAIKPYQAADVILKIYKQLAGKFVISIMAGWTFDMLESALPASARFVRVMPNTPLLVGEGMSLISSRYSCTEEEFAFAKALFEAAGKVAVVDDSVYTPANGISGCGPAFVYEFIEAMADGGVRYGVPRALAYELAAQTLIGAASMVLQTGQHPGALKDAVCSPGGTTIEGIFALERGGMRASVIDAVGSAVEKTLRMERGEK